MLKSAKFVYIGFRIFKSNIRKSSLSQQVKLKTLREKREFNPIISGFRRMKICPKFEVYNKYMYLL